MSIPISPYLQLLIILKTHQIEILLADDQVFLSANQLKGPLNADIRVIIHDARVTFAIENLSTFIADNGVLNHQISVAKELGNQQHIGILSRQVEATDRKSVV